MTILKHARLFALAIMISTAIRPGAAGAADTPLKIRLELPDGATISDVAHIVAKVSGSENAGINKVEFTVDGQLKATATSTPYFFDWDTLAETEGSHAIVATVTDAKEKTAQAKASFTIDNELSKGADFYAAAALAALKAQNPDLAVKQARRALKIAPENYRAARAIAAIDRQRGEINQAVAVIEQAKIPESDVDAQMDLVGLYVAQGAQSESTDEFAKAAGKAMEAYKRVLAARSTSAGADPILRGDIEAASGNWTTALSNYEKCSQGDTPTSRCLNRLLLADIGSGRRREAQNLYGTMTREKQADAVTHALHAYMLLLDHQPAKAREAAQEGLDAGVLPAVIVAAYSDLVLKDMKKARAEAAKALSLAPDLAEVQVLQSFVAPDPISADKAALLAIEKDPLIPSGYAVRAFHTMLSRDPKRFASADTLFGLALKRDANDTYALMGQALVYMGENRPKEAEPLLDQVVSLDPNSPDAHGVRAFNYSLVDKGLRTAPELALARKLDPEDWTDAVEPKPGELAVRVFKYRFPVGLSPAALDPIPAGGA